MKKTVFISAIVVLLVLLAACANKPQTATETPTVLPAPNTSLATPAYGVARVVRMEGLNSLVLHTDPDPQSPLAGTALPGEQGKVLGLDASNQWVLIQFQDKSGWAPVGVLEITIAQ